MCVPFRFRCALLSRVVTRLAGRLFDAIGRRVDGFHNRTRAARRRMLEIQRMTSSERKGQLTAKYQALCAGKAGKE
jgi:transposase, IS5 family